MIVIVYFVLKHIPFADVGYLVHMVHTVNECNDMLDGKE